MSDMLLCEAIRLGSYAFPKAIGGGMGAQEGRCALAAAAEAVGIRPWDNVEFVDYGALQKRWPILLELVDHPEPTPGSERALVRSVIWSLNDSTDWSREQIADWLEPIERARATTEQPAAEAVSA